MSPLEVVKTSPEPAFGRLLAALAIGVGACTLSVVATIASPTLGLAIGVVALLAFAALVLHEAGRLLADEEPGS